VASSSSVYGANPSLPKHEDSATLPLSPYAASKLATEAYALAYQHSFGLHVLAFRFFNVFGPLQPAGHAYAAVVPAFVSAALEGRPLPLQGDGKQSRDFTFVGTVTEVLTDAVRRKVTCTGPVNLAFGSRTDLLAVIDLLGELLGHSLEVEHLDPRPGDVRHSQADSTRLQELFPDVEAVELRDGLAQTVEWFRELES
jgi:UDP-glucose 4-epimerase